MAKMTIPKDDDFLHQYGGGIHQYGTKGASPLSDQNAEEFQRHMQALDAQNQQVPKISPHELVAQTKNQMVGAPKVEGLQMPAPENFGPPKIGPVEVDNRLDFGAPGSHSFKNLTSQFGPPKPGEPSSSELTANQANQLQSRIHAEINSTEPSQLNPSKKATSEPSETTGSNNKGGKAVFVPPVTYKQVEKQEIDNMLENAMQHMKIKDPDPSVWGS